MNYSVVITRRAQRELERLPRDAFERVRDAIRALGVDPRPAGCTKLTDRDGLRIRVGDYRVIYETDDAARCVTIIHVGNRRDVYR